MSFKLLVIGDSFARYDETHRHWADLWVESKGGSATHLGMAGSNAVNIVNEFEYTYRDRKWDFDAAVFHVPDFFRTEITSFKRDPVFDNPNNRIKFYDILGHPWLIGPTVNGDQDLNIREVHDFYHQYSLEPVQVNYYLMAMDPESENTKRFMSEPGRSQRDWNMLNTAIKHYTTASSRWLVRANYHALKNFNLQMQLRSKPVCFVFNPYIGPHLFGEYNTHFTALSNKWWMDIVSENVGDNHVALENAQICADLFDSYNKTAKIFPL